MGILGFFIPLVTYIWGWVKAKELEIGDLMRFWTFVVILQVILSLVGFFMGFVQNSELMEMLQELQTSGF